MVEHETTLDEWGKDMLAKGFTFKALENPLIQVGTIALTQLNSILQWISANPEKAVFLGILFLAAREIAKDQKQQQYYEYVKRPWVYSPCSGYGSRYFYREVENYA